MTDAINVTSQPIRDRVIRVSAEAHSDIRVLAAQQRMTIGEAVEMAVRHYLGPACKRAAKGAK